MKQARSKIVEGLRCELIGPTLVTNESIKVEFDDKKRFKLEKDGAAFWSPDGNGFQEVLHFFGESPFTKYGAGLLHPPAMLQNGSQQEGKCDDVDNTEDNEDAQLPSEVESAMAQVDAIDHDEFAPDGELVMPDPMNDFPDALDAGDEFEVLGPDMRHPSSMGMSFCVDLKDEGCLVVELPQEFSFFWQNEGSAAFPVNGLYEECSKIWVNNQGEEKGVAAWRRKCGVLPGTYVIFKNEELKSGKHVSKLIIMPEYSKIKLNVEVFPRELKGQTGGLLLTVVLRNVTDTKHHRVCTLFQTLMTARVKGGSFLPYPESDRPFSDRDRDEQSLALLYRESTTWGIGHGCACCWNDMESSQPEFLYLDVMPAVELPSMTPDIKDGEGVPISLSMRELANLPDDVKTEGWSKLNSLVSAYERWISGVKSDIENLPDVLKPVAKNHVKECETCLQRIKQGVSLISEDERVRKAFKVANKAMLLQQLASKSLKHRPLLINGQNVRPEGKYQSPYDLYNDSIDEKKGLGKWRAFQIAFLLMSLDGVVNEDSADREMVDLIWFPTGGGKTEAYLGLISFYLFYQRIRSRDNEETNAGGTDVLMRYTLRMLTTQQFQRAANLICAMEIMRREDNDKVWGNIPFSLGLWIGRDGAPNTIAYARTKYNEYGREDNAGNPMVINECPWCRSEIGRVKNNHSYMIAGISKGADGCPMLHCSDTRCIFGQQDQACWLPIEVIDERIYQKRPSFLIGTADKFAMIAYCPNAGALFGRKVDNGKEYGKQIFDPPGLIVQDELHLISGPLGTMYALYEGVIERLCSKETKDGGWVKPKIVSSTATIRGAEGQVRALYARKRTQLFPSPGLSMGDSFFGKYAKNEDESLENGRLYVGIHASEYGSILTTQNRVYSRLLFDAKILPEDKRDPWWTLLAFYNSIRELGGARSLFDSDVRSRLNYVFRREGVDANERRWLRYIEELTSRQSQSKIIEIMDILSKPLGEGDFVSPDVCLASNIIEVGVDIDRLSLMSVVGQPKNTAQYIQVTGRVGRRWWERPGLILTLYNPAKSRDRSHYEQFSSYHRRLYEQVEPTTATPFAFAALKRGLQGALITYARQCCNANVYEKIQYDEFVRTACDLLVDRGGVILGEGDDFNRMKSVLEGLCDELLEKWDMNPQEFERFPPSQDGEYLMLWPGQYATDLQKRKGVQVPSSMRQVDGSAELEITNQYTINN